MNSLNKIFKQANKGNWCIKAFCTTCGSQEFKQAVQAEMQSNPNFISDIKNCDFDQIQPIEEWTGGVYRLFQEFEIMKNSSEIFNYWIERNDISPIQYNHLFFYIIRNSKNTKIKDKWTFKLTEIAEKQNDESIVETLLIDLKEQVKYFPKLIKLVENKFKHSGKIMKHYKRK